MLLAKRFKPSSATRSKTGPTIPPKDQPSQTQGDRLRATLAESNDSEDETPADLTTVSDSEGTLVYALIPQTHLSYSFSDFISS